MRPIVARVAARLREERERQGVSQEAMALAARVSTNVVIRFETGKTGIQLDTLSRLIVLGLGLNWAQFMASTGLRADDAELRLDPAAAVQLSRAEAAQVRRWLAAVGRTLRRARRRAMRNEDPDPA
jgi:transcriptional regulator with XRE-family HTH domain